MQFGIDHPAVAFAADHGADLLHLRHDVDFADRRSVIPAAVALRDVAQGTRRGEVRNRVAGLFGKDVVRHGHQRVLLDEHRAVLRDERQTVDVGVDDDAQVGFLAHDDLRNLRQVLRQRLGVVGEFARGFAVQLHDLAAQLAQQLRHHDAAHRVHGVDDDLETALAHGGNVHQRQIQYLTDVYLVEILARQHMTDGVDGGVVEILLLGHGQHLLALGVVQKFAVGVEQFQGVPLAGVVRGGDDDAAVGFLGDDGHLGSRSGTQPDVDDVGTAGQQGPFHEVRDHFTRNTGVASYDYGKFFARSTAGDQAHVGRGEFYDVGRRQVLARGSADRAADARNGFDECHVLFGFTYTYVYEKFASMF